MVQDVGRAKGSVEDFLRLRQTVFVQVGANIAALGRVGGVEFVGVKLAARDNHNVVGIAGRVAALIPVVKASNNKIPAADLPVVAKVDVFERARLDSCGLLCGQAAAKVLAAIDHVVRWRRCPQC